METQVIERQGVSKSRSKWIQVFDRFKNLKEEEALKVEVPSDTNVEKFVNNVRQGLRSLLKKENLDYSLSIVVMDDRHVALMKKFN